MAKQDKKETKNKFPNSLKIQPWLKNRKFLGMNGRFGATDKLWKDFTFDELVEFKISHSKETINKHLTGVVPPDYVGPFDKEIELPVKPEPTTDGEA